MPVTVQLPTHQVVVKSPINRVIAKSVQNRVVVKGAIFTGGTTVAPSLLKNTAVVGGTIRAFRLVRMSENLLFELEPAVAIDGIVGLSLQAGQPGGAIPYLISGYVTDSALGALVPNKPVYADTAGGLTNAPPINGWLLQVGVIIGFESLAFTFDPATAIWRN